MEVVIHLLNQSQCVSTWTLHQLQNKYVILDDKNESIMGGPMHLILK